MSFLNQLKTQANALQTQNQRSVEDSATRTVACESACVLVNQYMQDLASQLNVIQPPAPKLTLDGKSVWPAMKLAHFRVDARKTMLRGREVFNYVAIGWDILPSVGGQLPGSVRVNFPPDLERVQQRLNAGAVKFERKDVRDSASNKLVAYEFVYECRAMGYVRVEPVHDEGTLQFRLANVSGFEIVHAPYPAKQVNQLLLDELAKLMVGQSSRFA